MILYETANSMGADYHRLGVLLKLPASFIEQVENDYRETVRITFEILVRWSDTVKDKLDVVEWAKKLSEVKRKLHTNVGEDALKPGEYLCQVANLLRQLPKQVFKIFI